VHDKHAFNITSGLDTVYITMVALGRLNTMNKSSVRVWDVHIASFLDGLHTALVIEDCPSISSLSLVTAALIEVVHLTMLYQCPVDWMCLGCEQVDRPTMRLSAGT
jgi:hypothetical protein